MYKKLSQLIVLVGAMVSGCAVVAVGAVGAVAGTGAAVASDPRSSGTVLNDKTLQTKLSAKYSNYQDANIYVNVYNGTVLLTGQVLQPGMRESAEFEAKASPGVKQIYDYLEVRLPQSFTSSSTDSYTTTQIRTKMLSLGDVDSSSVKIVTTSDVVYILGVVTPAQAKTVAATAASVGGVKKVVTLFEYVTPAPTEK